MTKRKKSKIETIDDLVEEIQSAESEVKIATNDESEVEDIFNVNKKREKQMQLAEDGDLDKSVKYIKRASNKIVEKLYRVRTQKEAKGKRFSN